MLTLMLASLFAVAPAAEHWPAFDYAAVEKRDPGRRAKAMRAYGIRKQKVAKTGTYSLRTYLCRGFETAIPFLDRNIELDFDGLPLRKHPGGAYYHPIFIARVALFSATAYQTTGRPEYLAWTKTGADKLLALMDERGALRYPIEFPLHYAPPLAPGWTSGMAQGIALSALARAYQLTCDERYREAGRKALRHLLTPMERGGTATDLRYLDRSLSRYVWFEEYPNPARPAYTLNGFMYTLLGLHDWSLVDPASEAGAQFMTGLRTLTKILPYYDYDGFTAYDLSPLVYEWRATFNPHYHAVHISLLSALHAITSEPVLKQYETRWFDAVGGEVVECAADERP